MNRLAVRQLGAAAAVVLVLALVGGGRYPLAVDLAVYAAGAAMAAAATAQLYRAAHDRRMRRHPADLPENVTRDQALTEAADWVITGRPADDYNGRTLTPAMVQREVLTWSGLEITEKEAVNALHSRLVFRGYRA